jgi:two-component system chemotaxis response regulator CheY
MIGYGKCALVVDDTEMMRRLLAAALGQEGFAVVQACDGIQALYEMQQRHFDVVVTDYHMPRLDGLDLLRQSQMAWPEIPVILFSELEWDKSDLAEARGAFAWVRRSPDPGVLLSILALALAVKQGMERESPHAMERVGA